MNIVKPLINKPFFRFCALLLTLLAGALSGCASQPQAPELFEGGETFADGFVAQGKISLRPLGESKVKGFSASYRWQQIGERYDLELWGALGQGRTRITGTANSIEIVDGTGKRVRSRNPERLLKRHLGWSLPLSVLPYWLQGQPAPAPPTPPAKTMRFQSNGDLETLKQLDWSLEFARYRLVRGPSREARLPGRLRASSDQLKLTIVARDWSI